MAGFCKEVWPSLASCRWVLLHTGCWSQWLVDFADVKPLCECPTPKVSLVMKLKQKNRLPSSVVMCHKLQQYPFYWIPLQQIYSHLCSNVIKFVHVFWNLNLWCHSNMLRQLNLPYWTFFMSISLKQRGLLEFYVSFISTHDIGNTDFGCCVISMFKVLWGRELG
jgi:hypothetical protein